jgi:hypothetical protein
MRRWGARCLPNSELRATFHIRCVFGFRSHLNGQRFDPETIRVMGLAYEMALISLRLSDRGDIANDVVAHRIIELAKAGERDPERLCEVVCRYGVVPTRVALPIAPDKSSS